MPSTISQSAYKYAERTGCVPVTQERDGKHNAEAFADGPRKRIRSDTAHLNMENCIRRIQG